MKETKDICGCSGPYTCKYHMGEFDYCNNNHCLCHKSYGDRIMNDAEKAYRRTHNQIIEHQKSMNNQPIFQPNEKWEEEFESMFCKQSPTVKCNGLCVSEEAKGRLKSFISTLLQEQKTKILELIEDELIGIFSGEWEQGHDNALDTIKSKLNNV